MKKYIIAGAIALTLLCVGQVITARNADATSCITGQQGGTGLCTATSSNIGQVPTVIGLLNIGNGMFAPIYGFANASGTSGGSGTTTVNGFAGNVFYIISGSGITSTVSNGTTTFILNLSNTGCVGNNFLQSVTATGTGICATPTGGASSTNVFGINGVTVNQVGVNATASLDTTFAASWSSLETFLAGATIKGTVTLSSTTNALVLTNGTGAVVAYSGTSCSAGQAPNTESATGTFGGCTTFLTANQNITLSGAVTGSGATSITTTFSTSTLYGLFSAASPIVFSTSTGQFSCPTCLTGNQSITVSLNGAVTGSGSGATSISITTTLTSPVTATVSTTAVTSSQITDTGVKNALELGDANGNFTAFAGSSCSYGYISTGDVATGTMVCVPASSTDIIYVDGNRADTYTQNGSYLYPFKTVSGALTAAQAVSSSYSGFAFILAPTTYVDGAPDTFPTQPFIIQGNEATLVEPSGATLPGSFDIYDLTGVGTFTESDNSLTFIHQWNNSAIVGSISLAGNATLEGMAFPSTTSTITALAGSLVGITGSFMQGTIISSGTLNITNSAINVSSTNWALLSTAGSVNMNGVSLLNLGLGGGIKISNGATSTPNNLAAVSVTVNSSTAGSAITAGTATTILCGIDGLTNLTGTFIPPTGSAFQACYDETRSVLSGLAVGTSTIPSTGIIDSDIAPNSFIATDGNRHLIATSTPAGGAGSVTTSSPGVANTLPLWTSASALGNSIVLQNAGANNVTINSSTPGNDLFDVVNASNTIALKISSTTGSTSSAVSFNVLGNASTSGSASLVNIFQILSSGHINSTGTIPTMGACGSSPSVVGTDSGGTITVGSGVVTSCTMNFQIPYETSNLFGLESDNSTAVTGDISALTTSSVTFSFSATLGGGKLYYFIGENQ